MSPVLEPIIVLLFLAGISLYSHYRGRSDLGNGLSLLVFLLAGSHSYRSGRRVVALFLGIAAVSTAATLFTDRQ